MSVRSSPLATVGTYVALAQGLDDPSKLTDYVLPEETVIYDRTGKIELARFGDAKREVVTFDQIPKVLLDATTAVEDKTFWDNAGFDPVAIVSAALGSLRGDARGASTITQQLVRARLLDPALVQDPHRTAERKLKEIIQSIRVTQYFRGEQGKQQIITAYLNQNYYGNQSYGVKAAAQSYFGIDLSKIDPAQAAIIAGLPKSPSNYDLVRNAIEQCTTPVAEGADCPKSQLVVPPDAPIVQRRDQILDLLASGGRTPMSGDQYSSAQFTVAKQEDVVLGSQATPRWIAPHFVWAVRDELADKLCGVDVPSCDALDLGGLRVTTTLDVGLQKIAEKWVRGGGHRAPREGPDGRRQGARLQEAPAVDDQPQEQGPPQRRTRRGRLPDRRARRLRRQRQLLRDVDQARLPAPVRRDRQGLPPAGLGVQAVQLRRRHRRQDDHRRHDADGRRHATSAAATRRTTPTASSADPSASATRSSSRSTSRPSRRWP